MLKQRECQIAGRGHGRPAKGHFWGVKKGGVWDCATGLVRGRQKESGSDYVATEERGNGALAYLLDKR